MIYIDNKKLNLFYILKNKYHDLETTYISFRPGKDIKVVTKNKNLINEIAELSYFKNNNFRIRQESFDFSPHLFYITYVMSCNEIDYLKGIYNDYLTIFNEYNINISMISEYGFIIENPDLEIIDEIYDKLYKKYSYSRIEDKHIFIIKAQVKLENN